MVVRGAGELVIDAARGFMAHKAFRLAAALAFYSLLSLAPLVVLAVSVAGLVFGPDAARNGLVDQFRGLVGDAVADVIETTLVNAQEPGSGILATVIGVVTLLVGASGVFGELRDSMNTVWEVPPPPDGGVWEFLRARFMSLGGVLAVCFLLLTSLVLSTALAAGGHYLEGYFPELPAVLGALNATLSFAVVMGLFAMIFKGLPDVPLRWRHVLPGAALTSLLFVLGKSLIGLYLGQAGVATPYGAAGSVVALVVWVYYSGLILFFGAELTRSLSGYRVGRGFMPRGPEGTPASTDGARP